jgi:ABC-2 type transport system ATP-binding protein
VTKRPRNPVLCLDRVTVRLGNTTALSRCSLELAPGERTALLGPNGAGKTTLLRASLGLCPLEAGTVSLDGISVGAMLEHPGIARQSTSLEYLTLHGRLQGVEDAPRRARELLEEWELPDTACRTLSLGQRQRLQIARSLVHRPDILLLDEPAANLDPQARHDLHRRLRAWNDRGGTLLWATHDLEEAIGEASTIAVLSQGSMRWIGKACEFSGAFPASQTVRFDNFCPTGSIASALGPDVRIQGEGIEVRLHSPLPPSTILRTLMDAGLAVQSFGPDRQSLFESYQDSLKAPPLEPAARELRHSPAPPSTSTAKAFRATFLWEAGNLRREMRFFLPFAVMQSLLITVQHMAKTPDFSSMCLLPVSLCASLCADSIAGERERSGLETLRATQAPLGAILLGKAALAWLAGFLPGLAFLALATTLARQDLSLWVLQLTGATLACTAFAARVAASAPTVRSAAQMSVLGSFFLGMGFVILPHVLPQGLEPLAALLPLILGLASLPLLLTAPKAWARA